MTVPSTTLVRTRESLHGVAEWLLAGPQYERAGTIRLQVTESGIRTKDGEGAIEGDSLVVRRDGDTVRVPLKGTITALAGAAGLKPSVPEGLYHDHSSLEPSSEIDLDQATAAELLDWFRRGQRGMQMFASDEEPVLWPEHFDLGISKDDVNYGISLGDAAHPEPYAYVGPHTVPTGDFWNAPFGAARPAAQLATAEDVAAFFSEGASHAESPSGVAEL